MLRHLRAVLFFVCLGGFACSDAEAFQSDALESAVEWLVAQQDESGAWKSRSYGSMKQGAALTSLVVYSLSFAPDSIGKTHQSKVAKAFEFLEKGTLTRNRVANPDGSLDHPVYSTSMYLVAAHRTGREIDNKRLGSLLQFLVSSQCTESRGFEATNPNYGGWDVIGPDVQPGKTSGTNVSATRFVLEAFEHFVPVSGKPKDGLDGSVVAAVRKSRSQAATWLKRIQAMNDDGGFRFSAQPNSALNKSISDDGEVLSYGTATCDGLLALKLAGLDQGHGFQSADRWLRKNVSAMKVPGFVETEFESSWPEAVKFYYFQTLARVLDQSKNGGWSAKLGRELKESVVRLQKPDGRFENKTALMREDDPIIATSFAVIALAKTR